MQPWQDTNCDYHIEAMIRIRQCVNIARSHCDAIAYAFRRGEVTGEAYHGIESICGFHSVATLCERYG
jgi:hypothetical protein